MFRTAEYDYILNVIVFLSSTSVKGLSYSQLTKNEGFKNQKYNPALILCHIYISEGIIDFTDP